MLRTRRAYSGFLAFAVVLVVAMCALSLTVGASHMSVADAVRALLGAEGAPEWQVVIVRDIRLPRTLLALIVGAGLSVVGAVMQGFFQNPMAGPYLVGVSSGASLGATVAILFGLDLWLTRCIAALPGWAVGLFTWGFELSGAHATPLFAFVGALGVTLVVYSLSRSGGKTPTATLLLTGIAVGMLASSISSFLMILEHHSLSEVVVWLMGGLSGRGWTEVKMVLPYFVFCMAVLSVFGRDLNVMLTGDEAAYHLGINVEWVKFILLVFSSLLAAAAVAVSGVIGFVGLVVPHMARHIVGPDHRRLLPATVLLGAALLTGADVVARSILPGSEVPIGIVTTFVGCPFFMWLLWRARRTG